MIDFDKDIAQSRHVIDALVTRAKVVMHNITNANTPGYKAHRVRFEEMLRDAHDGGGKTADVTHEVIRDESGAPGANNVSTFEEFALLEKVKTLHDIYTRKTRGYFRKLNNAISGHGG